MVNFVSAVAGIITAFFSAMVYILMTRKTTVGVHPIYLLLVFAVRRSIKEFSNSRNS